MYPILLTFIIFLIVLVGGYVVVQRSKNKSVNEHTPKQETNNVLAISNDSTNELQVQFNMLSEIQEIDESRLVEITDSKLLGHVNNLLPEAYKTATTAANASDAIQRSVKPLYEAIIPVGEKLVDSQNMKGANRGFYRSSEGISGHANLVKYDGTTSVAANVASSAMNVGSMVVGQYYMYQINNELESISSDISQIMDFQNNEYKSKVFALVTKVKKLSSFQTEILENEELRKSEISNLNRLEQQCIELLGQANLTIADYSKKMDMDIKEYEEQLIDVQYWVVYQETLLEILYLIANLKYALYLGTVSRNQCNSLLSTYRKQVKDVKTGLQNWHLEQMEKYGINLEEGYRERYGVDGFLHKVPGMIRQELNYRPVSKDVVGIITKHLTARDKHRQVSTREVFDEDIKLIGKEGKVYYLPADSI